MAEFDVLVVGDANPDLLVRGDVRPRFGQEEQLLTGAELVGYAREWFVPQAIVVGHANQRTVTTVYGELLELIQERQLRTVTMADVWAAPRPPFQGVSASGSVAG